jgi:hypothetical protein
MRDDLTTISDRLSRCGVPAHLIERHITKVEKYRNAHPIKIKRKRLDWPVTASGHVIRPCKPSARHSLVESDSSVARSKRP